MLTPTELRGTAAERLTDELIPLLLHELTKREIHGLDFGDNFIRFNQGEYSFSIEIKAKLKLTK